MIQVVVGIIKKPSGEILLASRPQGKGWAGWWEFPGGKIETNETTEHALIRELQEELGITPTETQSWLTRKFDYPATHDAEAKTVLLHFYFVTNWLGELTAKEDQQLSWQNPKKLTVSPILPANLPIMKALALPSTIAITNMAKMGEAAFFDALKLALQKDLSLIQIREKQLNVNDLSLFTRQILALAKPYGAQVFLNHSIDLAIKLGVDGVHLTSQQLIQLTEKPSNLLVSASTHNAQELAQAQKLDLDFVVLSPILPTKSHPQSPTLGWAEFKNLIKNVEIPIYALGGMSPVDLATALSCGARGIAMQRAVW